MNVKKRNCWLLGQTKVCAVRAKKFSDKYQYFPINTSIFHRFQKLSIFSKIFRHLHVRRLRESRIRLRCRARRNARQCNQKLSFYKDTAVMKNWRCGVQITVWIVWYYLNAYSRGHIYQLLGGDLPPPHGSPITKDTISSYIAALTDRVAAVGLRKLLSYQLTGKVQIDETFVRSPRKHNRGRFPMGRKFTLVTTSRPIN